MNAEKHCVGAKYETHGTGHVFTCIYHASMYVCMWWESGVHECGNTLSRCHTYYLWWVSGVCEYGVMCT